MAYTVTSDTLGLAIGPVAETANDVHEALIKARQMYETGLVNVSIKDQAGHKTDPAIRLAYAELAEQWSRIAEHAEASEQLPRRQRGR